MGEVEAVDIFRGTAVVVRVGLEAISSATGRAKMVAKGPNWGDAYQKLAISPPDYPPHSTSPSRLLTSSLFPISQRLLSNMQNHPASDAAVCCCLKRTCVHCSERRVSWAVPQYAAADWAFRRSVEQSNVRHCQRQCNKLGDYYTYGATMDSLGIITGPDQ